MKKCFVLYVFSLIFIMSCKTLMAEKPIIQGMIYNNENEPVSDASIIINGKAITVSDIYGHFSIDKLRINQNYFLVAKKKGYEDSIIDFKLLNASQVIYLRMYSAGELLSAAEENIALKKYSEAEKYLIRAENTGASVLNIYYLRSIILFKEKNYEMALKTALDILEKGYNEPYVYILIADIYEKGLNDWENAKEYLQKSLNISYNPEIKDRLSEK